jgi:5-formyltetrahydrofolate cyclo-ligase
MISNEKQMLRAKMRAIVRDFPAKAAASQQIREHLRRFSSWKSARVVFCFTPLAGEPDWLGEELPADKLLAYPKIGEDGMLLFLFGTDFAIGAWGAKEPMGGTVASAPDLVLVPGLAFDATGVRLGRGKGFYDRWLAANPSVTSLGVCFKCQILESLPAEAHDARVDAILTEDGVLVP